MNLAIKASGMVTAVGFNSPASCEAIRAGIRGVSQSHLWDAESGEHLGAGKVYLPHWWNSISKLADLVAPAIGECLQAACPLIGPQIPILLGVSASTRPYRSADLDREIMGEIAHRLGFQMHPSSEVISRDHVSLAVGLQKAKQLLNQEKLRYCIVAGVDNLIDQDLAAHYLEQRRLLTPQNSNGFVPGEAGSAVLVGKTDERRQNELEILGIGLAKERASIESDEPLRAEGIIQALAQAFKEAGRTLDDLQYRITDLNGEHYKFKEMAFAMLRYERRPKPKLFELWHPTEYIGEVGAAIGPILLAVALHASQKEYGVGRSMLCTLGNDDGERAVVVATFPRGAIEK